MSWDPIQQPEGNKLNPQLTRNQGSFFQQLHYTIRHPKVELYSTHPWKPREYRLLFGNLIPTISKTDRNMSTWKPLIEQILAETANLFMEETAILQPIGSNDKRKQPELAPEKLSKTRTPIFSSPLPINQIMAYRDIAKLEKFSGEEDNMYLWIAKAKKAITANNWDDNRAI
ncbi:hypothetical protein G9A89_017202 [Geosiphon pyriformis]|nr:hypothetical protein G9A89_017202 [Geosiphon pyriformis]